MTFIAFHIQQMADAILKASIMLQRLSKYKCSLIFAYLTSMSVCTYLCTRSCLLHFSLFKHFLSIQYLCKQVKVRLIHKFRFYDKPLFQASTLNKWQPRLDHRLNGPKISETTSNTLW